MRSKKKPSKDPVLQAGQTKIPAKWLAAVIISVVGGLGGTAAGQFQNSEQQKKIDQLEQARMDIVEMKNDIRWIKDYLSADGLTRSEAQRSPLRLDSPSPRASSKSPRSDAR